MKVGPFLFFAFLFFTELVLIQSISRDVRGYVVWKCVSPCNGIFLRPLILANTAHMITSQATHWSKQQG